MIKALCILVASFSLTACLASRVDSEKLHPKNERIFKSADTLESFMEIGKKQNYACKIETCTASGPSSCSMMYITRNDRKSRQTTQLVEGVTEFTRFAKCYTNARDNGVTVSQCRGVVIGVESNDQLVALRSTRSCKQILP